MKKSIFRISAFVLILALVSFCKTSRNGEDTETKKNDRNSEKTEHSSVQSDSARDAGEQNDNLQLSKSGKYDEKAPVKTELPKHKPPNSQKTDSIKDAKTREKLKGK